jgi:hypothetical protein
LRGEAPGHSEGFFARRHSGAPTEDESYIYIERTSSPEVREVFPMRLAAVPLRRTYLDLADTDAIVQLSNHCYKARGGR